MIALIVLLSVALFSGKKEVEIQPSSSSSPKNSNQQTITIQVLSVIPTENTPLIPGKTQTFIIRLNEDIRLSDIGVKLLVNNYSIQETPREAGITLEIKDNQSLYVTTKETVRAYSNYQLILENSQRNENFYEANFISDKPQASPAPSNNPTLAQYLPYETNSFILTFHPDSNTYIFNFKYNDASREPLQTQYDQAKQEAIKFIQGKGIELNSIVIEWRYS